MKRRSLVLIAGAVAVTVGAAFGLSRLMRGRPMDAAAFAARYAEPLAKPVAGLAVYHLGHSLVGRDMPVMLDQLAAAAGMEGHRHASQLGWGASLRQHWQGESDVPGFAEENASAAFVPAREALASGMFDAFILTEMVEIRDAIRYHDSGAALAKWAQAGRKGNPDLRVYLYETWHRLDDPEGWLTRIDLDSTRAWQDAVLRVAMAQPETGTIHVIPGGPVLAALVRAMETGQIPGLDRREALFARDAQGQVDPIHLNDLGAYVIALTHFATLYQQSPEGLPHALQRAGGAMAQSLPQDAVLPVQRLVWEVVAGYGLSGVAG